MAKVEKLWNEVEGKPERQVTAVVIGCGQRGQNYATFALELPGWLKIVGVADPLKHRRDKIAHSAGMTDLDYVFNAKNGVLTLILLLHIQVSQMRI